MGHEKLVSVSLETSESQNVQEINFSSQKYYKDVYTQPDFVLLYNIMIAQATQTWINDVTNILLWHLSVGWFCLSTY